MAFLVRKLEHGKAWRDLRTIQSGLTAASAPAWAVAELAPRPSDDCGLSCYRIEGVGPEHVVRVAGAMSLFAGPSKGGERQLFAVAEEADLVAAGIDVLSTSGTTLNIDIDALHVELRISNLDQAMIAFELFWKLPPIEIKGAKINAARAADAKADRILFTRAVREKDGFAGHIEYAVDHVRKGDLLIAGDPILPKT